MIIVTPRTRLRCWEPTDRHAFAAMHADQQGYALGPFLLLVAISLVLCAVRLRTRSVAASVLVHASYNFLLFSLMLLGTGGFRHLDKM